MAYLPDGSGTRRTSTTGQKAPSRFATVPTVAQSTARQVVKRTPVDTTPGTQGGYYTWTNSAGGVQPQSLAGLQASMDEYYKSVAAGQLGTTNTSLSGSSGGGSGGGGGGGGGGSTLTQAMIDAMARALGAQGPQLQLNYQDLPAFQGQSLGAFNAQPYTQALGQIDTATAADQANIAANQQAVSQQLQSQYSNPYATAQVIPGATTSTIGQNLMGTVGGQASTQSANQINAGNQDSQATFQNLLQVLAAADQGAQQSRMSQVGMDANYARQNLDATALGLRGGVNTAQATAANTWAQAQQERDYQNSLLQQQYERENAQARQTLANTQATSNYQTATAAQTARLQPILDLILQSGGTNLNLQPLFAALGIQ